MEKHKFKVAVLQKCSMGCNYNANTNIIIEEMHKAVRLQADILLLPECFITGYKLPINNSEAIDENSIYIKSICSKAKELEIGVIATALTKGSQKPQNSAFVIDKNGYILMKYSKVHTCDFADEECLESGDSFKVCDFDGIKLGIMICYDREYPESARVLMMKGAEIILVPNDCGSMLPRINALSTRAYENMVGIVMANPPGKNCGNSCAFSPICWDENGDCINNTIILADEESTELYIAEFDLHILRAYRGREMMGNTFRKVKAYSELINEQIKSPFLRKNN